MEGRYDGNFKSYSNSHIDMVVMEEDGRGPWRATGFYGHLDIGMRYISWDLLKTLHSEAKISWVVFGDFNEIVHLHEKLGWKEREANQMEVFKEALSVCGISDLGVVGQKYTWCNGRFGDQCTLVRLDRMVAIAEEIHFRKQGSSIYLWLHQTIVYLLLS